jgi:CubicO group peptidase (beta-lactamase class C family)
MKHRFSFLFILISIFINFQDVQAKKDWQWPEASLKEVGLNKKDITRAHRNIQDSKGQRVGRIQKKKYQYIDSMLIVRNGKLVYEKYYNNGSKNRPHKLESAGKSFLSAIFGIAYDQGLFKSVNTRVYDYYNQFFKDIKNWDEVKASMTLHNLMTMRSGWDCDINFADKRCSKQMLVAKDNVESIKWVLDRPMAFKPGEKMQYTDANPIMLDTLIYLVSGKTSADIAKESLYGPMGVSVESFGAFTSRQMAMLGQLFLKKGNWHGQQIISEKWVEMSTANIYPFDRKKPGIVQGYGYYWWIGKFKSKTSDLSVDSFFAAGNGGQYIIVLPKLDMVVVFTGADYETAGMTPAIKIVEDYILPAVIQ